MDTSTPNLTTMAPALGNSTRSSMTMNPYLVHLFSILYISASILGSFANVCILIAFFSVRKLRTRINYFLASLAVSDVILLAIYVPFEMEWHIRSYFKHSVIVCDFVYTLCFITISSSSLNLMAVSGYRFLTIVYPFCSKHITKTHVFSVIAIIWFYACMTALLPVMGWRERPSLVLRGNCWFQYKREFIYFIIGANWLLPAVLVLIFYAMILRIARIHAQKIAKDQVRLNREHTRRRHQLRGAISLAKIVAVYLVCWFPYIIVTLVGQIVLSFRLTMEGRYLIVFLAYSNATINPFLYAGLCEDFKKVFRQFARHVLEVIRSSPRSIRFLFSKGVCRFCPRFEVRQHERSRAATADTHTGSNSSLYHQAATILSSAS